MICDICGKSNIRGLTECAYCGADMPKTSGGGGFADILTYHPAEGTASVTANGAVYGKKERNMEGISDADMQKLIKKSDTIMKSTQKNSLFGLIAIVLSILILLCSILVGNMTRKSVKESEEKTATMLAETQQTLVAYKAQIDTLVEEIGEIQKERTEDGGVLEKPGYLEYIEGYTEHIEKACKALGKYLKNVNKIVYQVTGN